MNHRTISLTPVILLAGLLAVAATACQSRSLEGKIIVTETPGDCPERNLISGEAWRYVNGARLVAVDPEKPGSPDLLSNDFYSACSPMVSSDCRLMVFAAQQKQNDIWQIWEMDLVKRKYRKITALQDNCTDPVLLPNGRVIFTRQTSLDSATMGHALYSCNSDGSDLKQITFHPYANFATSVLKDGRLLTISRQLIPVTAGPMLMVLRPDGTKMDLFYGNAGGSPMLSRASETTGGEIFFIETDSLNPRHGDLVSIRYNRPLHSRINYSGGIEGDFKAVATETTGRLMVSFRLSDTGSFALHEFDPVQRSVGKKIYGNTGYQVTDASWVQKQERPKKLPSEVDFEVKTGLLMCQNINFTTMPLPAAMPIDRAAVKIEVVGMDSVLGIVDVEDDGSFYLKVTADMPFRIRTLDQKGNVVRESCDWIWIRPNERRGCIGCHEDPELAPENLVPLAVKKDPVNVPVHISEISDKEVELE